MARFHLACGEMGDVGLGPGEMAAVSSPRHNSSADRLIYGLANLDPMENRALELAIHFLSLHQSPKRANLILPRFATPAVLACGFALFFRCTPSTADHGRLIRRS